MRTVRILVADDHELVRRGVRTMLEAEPKWKVVGEAKNGREAVERAKRLKPDVTILDISMPELDGLEATPQIRKAVPDGEVLILTMHESDLMVRRLLEAGACGYILKSDLARNLVAAVRAVSRHRRFLGPKASELVLEGYLKASSGPKEIQPPHSPLTPREGEILRLLAEGKSNKEIASLLDISERTAETHRANIMRKLNLHSMSDLVRYAVRNKIIQP